MRVHGAVWHFAEQFGNLYAQDYTAKRKRLPDGERQKRDNKWLRGRGGVRLRKAWLGLTDSERSIRMEQHLDKTFPTSTNGIVDDRFKKSQVRSQTHPNGNELEIDSSAAMVDSRTSISTVSNAQLHTTPLSKDDPQLYDKVARLSNARSKYHKETSAQELIRLTSAYNNGDMSTLLNAAAAAVRHAVLYSRSQDAAKTSEEAFVAVGVRVSDALAGIVGVTSFDPVPELLDERYSVAFSQERIGRLEQNYRDAADAAYTLCAKSSRQGDSDPPLLEASHRFFGKPRGIPNRKDYFDAV